MFIMTPLCYAYPVRSEHVEGGTSENVIALFVPSRPQKNGKRAPPQVYSSVFFGVEVTFSPPPKEK